ncbi:MAG: response regulator [Bdellovibrionales bacterium]|nr:response regulator [Bdellovibrionales bacterium]
MLERILNGKKTIAKGQWDQSKKILLVEDDPSWQLLIGAALRAMDASVKIHYVRSVKHAENLLYKNSNYDLIIVDQYLDGNVTGKDLWSKCQKEYRRIPFVMVSGMDMEEYDDLFDGEKSTPDFFNKSQNVENLKMILGVKLKSSKFINKQIITSFFLKTLFLFMLFFLNSFNKNEPLINKHEYKKIEEVSFSKNIKKMSLPKPGVLRPLNHQINSNGKVIISSELRSTIQRIIAKADEINMYLKNQSTSSNFSLE